MFPLSCFTSLQGGVLGLIKARAPPVHILVIALGLAAMAPQKVDNMSIDPEAVTCAPIAIHAKL